MTAPHKPFYFLRHGETDWNRNGICMGHQDIPLNKMGLEQAQAVANSLIDEPITHIATSPLIRAARTAQIIAGNTHNPIAIIDELKEHCWGVKEGQVYDNTTLERWLSGQTPEGAETIEEFDTRVKIGLQKSLLLPSPVLIIAHGGVYLAISRILDLPAVSVRNCSLIYHRPPQRHDQPWFCYSVNEE